MLHVDSNFKLTAPNLASYNRKLGACQPGEFGGSDKIADCKWPTLASLKLLCQFASEEFRRKSNKVWQQ